MHSKTRLELNEAIKQFINTVRTIADREMIRPKSLDLRNRFDLTTREKQILSLVIDGLQNKQIADRLSTSTRTVKFHVTNILRKHSVQDRHELSKLY